MSTNYQANVYIVNIMMRFPFYFDACLYGYTIQNGSLLVALMETHVCNLSLRSSATWRRDRLPHSLEVCNLLIPVSIQLVITNCRSMNARVTCPSTNISPRLESKVKQQSILSGRNPSLQWRHIQKDFSTNPVRHTTRQFSECFRAMECFFSNS